MIRTVNFHYFLLNYDDNDVAMKGLLSELRNPRLERAIGPETYPFGI
jgi:hypothetical protein